MTTLLPSPSEFRNIVSKYIDDGEYIANTCFAVARDNEIFVDIYRYSLATHTVLGELSTPALRPTSKPARSIALRVPLLVSMGQASVAHGELRRFVELISWAIYFTDHPIEWQSFRTGRGGFAREMRKPISYAANRELSFYLDYALELMDQEPSGLGSKAVNNCKNAVKALNAAVHPGHLAKAPGTIPPHDNLTTRVLRDFRNIQKLTFANCVLLMAAYRRAKFNRLNASARAHFDWLVGSSIRREVRKGPFGLP